MIGTPPIDWPAVQRAVSQGIKARRWATGRYRVTSANPEERGPYDVLVEGERFRCTCVAGSYGRLCKHVAAVQLIEALTPSRLYERRLEESI